MNNIEPTFDISLELERKANDSLARILQDLDQGVSSPSQAAYALRILFDTTSGLVPKDLFDLISEASADIGATHKDVDRQMKLLINPADRELVLLTYQYGEAKVGFNLAEFPSRLEELSWKKSIAATFENEFNPFEVARSRFDAYVERLQARGFVEVQPC